jgi:hypothetical protein
MADLRNDIASVRTARGKLSWIATWTRPDLAFAMGRLSQIIPENINSEATKSCNDLNDYLKKTVKRNKLDVKSLHVVFYSKTKTVMRMSCTGFQRNVHA